MLFSLVHNCFCRWCCHIFFCIVYYMPEIYMIIFAFRRSSCSSMCWDRIIIIIINIVRVEANNGTQHEKPYSLRGVVFRRPDKEPLRGDLPVLITTIRPPLIHQYGQGVGGDPPHTTMLRPMINQAPEQRDPPSSRHHRYGSSS
jgi:hypothetical protein